MSFLHKIIFALTVCFVSLSVVLGSFAFYATNDQVFENNFNQTDQKLILQALKEEPYTAGIDYRYSLVYLLVQTTAQGISIDDFTTPSLETLDNFVEWLRGDRETIEISLPANTNEVLAADLDQESIEFVDTYKGQLEVCAGDKTTQTQQNGYSPGNFCLPSQVRNGQVNFTTYVNARDENLLDDVVVTDLSEGVKINPEQVEFASAYVTPRNTLVGLRKSLPFLLIFSVLLVAIWYYSQKLQKEDLYLGIIRLLGYVSVSVISLALLGVFFFNEAFFASFLEANSLPGLNPTVLDIFSAMGRGVVIDSLAPSFIIGGLLSIVVAINYFVYNQRKIEDANDNELFQLHERDIYDQSVLIAKKPAVPTSAGQQKLSRKQLETLERIKDQQAAQNYQLDAPTATERAAALDPQKLRDSLASTLQQAPSTPTKPASQPQTAPAQPVPAPTRPTVTPRPSTEPRSNLANTLPPRKTVVGGSGSRPLIESNPDTNRRTISF